MRLTAHYAPRVRQSRAIAGALSHTLLSLAQRWILHGFSPQVRRGILPVRQTHNCGDRETFDTLRRNLEGDTLDIAARRCTHTSARQAFWRPTCPGHTLCAYLPHSRMDRPGGGR
jgi:hypothetical protein